MSLTKPAPESFRNITKLTLSGDCTLEKLFAEPNFLDAFIKQHSKLVEYMLAHVLDVLNIALGKKQCEINGARYLCKQIMIRQTAVFSQKASSMNDFAHALRDFGMNITRDDDVITYCLIVQFFAKLTNGEMLLRFGKGNEFMTKMLEMKDLECVRDMLVFFATDGHPQFSIFLDRYKIGELLWERYTTNKDRFELSLLTGVVSSLDANSESIRLMANKERMQVLIDMALGDDRKVSDEAMAIVYELCSHCDEDDDSEEGLFAHVFGSITERADDFAAFLGSDRQYSQAKTRVIELMAGVIASLDEPSESILVATGSLFKQMLANPQFSILHCGFMKLFMLLCDAGVELDELDEQFDIRQTIVTQLADRKPGVQFYGHLYKMAEIFTENEDLEDTPEFWQEFVRKDLSARIEVNEKGFGGKRPVKGAAKANGSDDGM